MYCANCHRNGMAVIPRLALTKGDFRPYRVCERSRITLEQDEQVPRYLVQSSPNVKVEKGIKGIVVLRRQLRHLREYLESCSRVQEDKLSSELFFQHETVFSLKDLVEIEKGQMVHDLRLVIQTSIQHILACPICQLKGFICEYCHSPQIIYPFQIRLVVACTACNGFFHRYCFREDACLKCLRLVARSVEIAELAGK